MKHVYLLYWHWEIQTLERDPGELQLPVRSFEVLSDAFEDALERVLYGEVKWDRAPTPSEVYSGWKTLENQRWSFEWEDVEVLIVRLDFQGCDPDLESTRKRPSAPPPRDRRRHAHPHPAGLWVPPARDRGPLERHRGAYLPHPRAGRATA